MNIRSATKEDIPAIARVHIASWRSAYPGIVPDTHLAGLSQEKHEQRHHRIMTEPGRVYLVAELDEHGVVGFLTGGPERNGDPRFPAEIYAIYILAEHHQRGIGRALIQAWAAQMLLANRNAALVWVLADNLPAIAFYERLGARQLREDTIKIGGAELREIAFGWDSLDSLASPVSADPAFQPIIDAAKLMQRFPAPWFVSGGWAIDLFLGRVTRSHSDIEIGIYRRDQHLLWRQLPGWSLEKAVDHSWIPWSRDEDLRLPIHQIKANKLDASPAEFEFFLNERTDSHWLSRRHEGLERSVAEVMAVSDLGIPFLAPEIQLLYKAKQSRPKDHVDFDAALPRLSASQRAWLADALTKFHPEFPWLAAMR